MNTEKSSRVSHHFLSKYDCFFLSFCLKMPGLRRRGGVEVVVDSPKVCVLNLDPWSHMEVESLCAEVNVNARPPSGWSEGSICRGS